VGKLEQAILNPHGHAKPWPWHPICDIQMTNGELEKRVNQLVKRASDESRRRFALETIRLLRQSAASAIQEQLSEGERALLSSVLDHLSDWEPSRLSEVFNEYDRATSDDPIRSIEFDPVLTDLLVSIDEWLNYCRTGNPRHVFSIAIARINTIDYAIGGDREDYSIDNMLGAPEMAAEYERIRQMLSG
jgi:hypothetical protein